ncbi:hypothetical protein FRC07_009568 [Ceratobasidium sp. 392]|nr:hypothetical protein FRC07_009568 [Ceratobasidium sp. 392]
MAGAFARSVKAERFKNPSPGHPVMREIARQATVAWGRRGAHAIAAHDLSWIDIPQPQVEEQAPNTTLDLEGMVWENDLWDEPQEPDQPGSTVTKRKWDNEASSQRGGGSSRGHYWKRGRGRGRGGRGGGRGGHVDAG